ncbi:Glycosyltransferase involved in cell wall bisynthesis [Verrucomicrobium sp. GAS474]|uniref:glycosyltransferase n=1 Tax=Verrucomicrobium sp. GAS474 TaxID=1882831 RepID=UPI00087D2D45|nr:glycosyltransferase [Verrucomicrobium sp. GAS474]SDU22872.1 Glycosyltransferase involved in cell wall bisynthesis [Verrucomicrobium sp. GAS474]
MPPSSLQLSLILPIYNEENAVGRTLDELIPFAETKPEWEFVIVDDGSLDRTPALIAARLSAPGAPANVHLLALTANGGKGNAVRAGFSQAKGERLCFTDGDLPYSLDQVLHLGATLAEFDVVIGSRNLPDSKNEGVVLRRQLLGGGFNRLVRLFMGIPHRDTQAGLKGFRREVGRKLFEKMRIGGFSFDVELLYLAKKYGHRVGEIPVRVSSAHSYKTSKLKLIRDSLRMFLGLVQIRFNDVAGKY